MQKSIESSDNKLSFSEEQETVNEYFKSMLEDSKSTGILNTLDFSLGNKICRGHFLLDAKTQLPKEIILKENYKQQSECQVCQKKFILLLKKKRHCKFCGGCICDSHSKRRHANPKDHSKFYRCCDFCHYKYLKAFIEDDFDIKLNRKEIDLKERKEELIKREQELLRKQQKLGRMYQQFEENKLENERKQEMILEEIRESEKENEQKLMKIGEVKQKKRQIEEQIQLLGEQTEQLSNDLPHMQKNNQQEEEKSLQLSKELLQKQKEVIIAKKFLKEVERLEQAKLFQEENHQQNNNSSIKNDSSEDEPLSALQQRESIQNEVTNLVDISKQFDTPNQQLISQNQDKNIKDVNSCKLCLIF